MLNTDNPAAFYPDVSGGPLQGGLVYFGLPGQNPVTNPLTVYWDSAGTQPAAQPVKIFNGRTVRQDGTPARIWVIGDYSKLVQDVSGRQIVYETNQPQPPTVQLSVTDRFSGTGAPATFALSATPADATSLDVYVGGVYQQKNSYTLVGNQLTITATVGVTNVEAVTRNTLNYANVAQTMTTQVTAATTAAGAAATSRAAIDNRIYPGTYAVAPTTRPDSSAIQEGDLYFGTDGFAYERVGGLWKSEAQLATSGAVAAAIAAGNAQAAVATGGIAAFYATYAVAIAAVAGPALNAYVEVLADENKGGRRSIYQKTGSSTLTWACFADGPQSSNDGVGANIRRIPGVAVNASAANAPVIVEIGDSNSAGSAGDPMTLYIAPMSNPGTPSTSGVMGNQKSPFYGWTGYNKAASGTSYNTWAAQCESIIAVPATSNAVADIVALNPSVILIQLGQNDFNSSSVKANWTDAFFRGRMAVLVNFLLARTKASIVLCMPHPLNWHNGVASITQFSSAAEARDVNRIIREAHQAWIGLSDRVEVFDSHTALFGNYCDWETTDCQDPEGGGALINDGLHMSSLGSTRRNQYLTRQLDRRFRHDGTINTPSLVLATDSSNPANQLRTYTAPNDLILNAIWSITVYGDAANAAGKTLFAFYLDNAWADALTGSLDSLVKSNAVGKFDLERLELLAHTGARDKIRRLLAINNGVPFKVWKHGTSSVYNASFSGASYSQTKGGDSGFPNGRSWGKSVVLEGDLFTGSGVWTFYGTTFESMPFANLVAPMHSITVPDGVNDMVWRPPVTPLSGNAFTGALLNVHAPSVDGGGTYELYKISNVEVAAGGAETRIATFSRGNQVQNSSAVIDAGQVLAVDASKPNFHFKRLTGSTKALVLTLY